MQIVSIRTQAVQFPQNFVDLSTVLRLNKKNILGEYCSVPYAKYVELFTPRLNKVVTKRLVSKRPVTLNTSVFCIFGTSLAVFYIRIMWNGKLKFLWSDRTVDFTLQIWNLNFFKFTPRTIQLHNKTQTNLNSFQIILRNYFLSEVFSAAAVVVA